MYGMKPDHAPCRCLCCAYVWYSDVC